MGLFTKKIGTVFLKETSDVKEYIEKMERLKEDASDEIRKKIEKQISYARYGEAGEKNIAFQLKSSGIDMYVLHDIFFTIDGIPAQIDYLVITRKHIYAIECKNLYGNIEIDNKGTFIRNFQINGKWVREGMESPITQNERHLLVLKELRRKSEGNSLLKKLFESDYSNCYKSIVVLANPKTILNDRYAKKEIKEKVIRADQLIAYIKSTDEAEKNYKMSESAMYDLARFYLNNDQPKTTDYTSKYAEMVQKIEDERKSHETCKDNAAQETAQETPSEPVPETVPKTYPQDQTSGTPTPEQDKDGLIKRLKAFRLAQSRSENKKPYMIFNDAQMMDLIQKNPKNKEELQQV
ncbi:MAG: NERD domain-containing protein, partial [Lachnospiraceae bacterium]|nr:NERD domain-containing protein [Lachnospiraceae bacterium]